MQAANFEEFIHIYAMFPALESRLAERSVEDLYADYVTCFSATLAEPMDYFKYGFFDMDPQEQAAYVTRVRYKHLCEQYNAANVGRIFDDKAVFGLMYEQYLGRRWMHAEGDGFEDFASFCASRECLVLKPRMGGYGRRVAKVSTNNPEELWKICFDEACLVEDFIVQHEALCAIHPSSVNCVRVATVADSQGVQHVVGAALRCGAGGSFTDSGLGMCAPVSLDSGIIAQSARDHFCVEYEQHPETGITFAGYGIPEWDQLMQCSCDAAAHVRGIRLANWDWALAADGRWLLMEGNVAGGFGPVQEAWRRGFTQELKDLMGTEGR